MLRLTSDQQQAIQQAGERPVEITDPDTNAVYYLVPADQFREMMELLEEEGQRRDVEPDVTNLEGKLEILGTIAKQYPESSPEQSALIAAAHAMMFVQHVETVAKFQRWVSELTKPPTALQVLHIKLAGVDCPHELLDESTREVEVLLERLRNKRN